MIDKVVSALSVPWVGTLAGFIGVGLAIFFYFRSKKNPRLSYQVSEFSVVGGSHSKFPEELEIFFDGKKVPRVTTSKVIVWNSGNSTLDGRQIVLSDPLRMEVKDGDILRASVKRVTREVNSVVLSSENSGQDPVNINFEYLDQEDGFSLEVIHSGAKGDLSFLGTLKELPRGFTQVGVFGQADMSVVFRALATRRGRVAPLLLPLILGALGFFGGIFAKQVTTVAHYVDSSIAIEAGPSVIWMLGGGLYASFPGLMLWVFRRKYPISLQDDRDKVADDAK